MVDPHHCFVCWEQPSPTLVFRAPHSFSNHLHVAVLSYSSCLKINWRFDSHVALLEMYWVTELWLQIFLCNYQLKNVLYMCFMTFWDSENKAHARGSEQTWLCPAQEGLVWMQLCGGLESAWPCLGGSEGMWPSSRYMVGVWALKSLCSLLGKSQPRAPSGFCQHLHHCCLGRGMDLGDCDSLSHSPVSFAC